MSSIVSGLCAGCASMCAVGCCASVGSVCNSCFGNDKPSTEPPSVTSGRKRSVFLLAFSVVLAFLFCYGLAPALGEDGSLASIPGTGSYVSGAWNDGCETYGTEALRSVCRSNSAVYRVGLATVVFYLFAGFSAWCRPTSNREIWPAKLFLYSVGVVATVFVPSKPLFSDVFMNVGRAGGVLFMILQQIVLLDLSYNLNENLVARSDNAESLEIGSGKKWLATILILCGVLYVVSIVAIGLLFHFYGGCSTNEAFLAVTLVASVVATTTQLCVAEDASLLTSAFVTAYATYLAFVAVNRNPDETCNPSLKQSDALSVVLGVALTVMSLVWVGWSNTARKRLLGDNDDDGENARTDSYDPPAPSTTSKPVQGIVMTDPERGGGDYGSTDNGVASSTSHSVNPGWKINALLALVACWISMTLTGWGSVLVGGDLANPQVHDASMWAVVGSQWTVWALYLWTLVAPKLFPDRDFN